MELNIGVTGTRDGMNKIQEENIKDILEKLIFEKEYTDRVFHHGQCIGVDVQAVKILKQFGFTIISHPPVKKDLLGISYNDLTYPPKSYFARNRNIVDECNILFVVPKENQRQSKGGTWYTHDYGVIKKKQIFIFYPNGEIELK